MKKFEISANKSFDGMEVRNLLQEQGIPQQQIAFPPVYFVFKNENVKVKVKYGFVLHNGFTGSSFLL